MKSKKEGFTLIELLLTICIFSAMMVTIYSTFATGVAAWKKSTVESARYQQAEWVLQKLARELKNVIHYSPIEFIGEEGKLSFPAILNSSLDESDLNMIYKLTYSLKGKNDLLIFKRNKAGQNKGFSEEKAKWQELISQVKEINFRYSYKSSDESNPVIWKKSWDFPDRIPQGVRIKLLLDNNKTQGEKDAFEKTVFIPMGVLIKEK